MGIMITSTDDHEFHHIIEFIANCRRYRTNQPSNMEIKLVLQVVLSL